MTKTDSLIQELVNQYGKSRNSLMPVLQGVILEENTLSEDSLLKIAEELDLSAAEVYGTASFYSFLDTIPRGKNIIRVCKTISCHMKGKEEIISALEQTLQVKAGETTHDRKFSLLTTNCLGWCHKGPVMLVNNEVFPELNAQKAIAIVEKISKETH